HLRFHLVISDWLMPGMDGLELVANVRKLPATRDLPFLMVTSQSDQEHWLRAEDAGVSGFVVKPFDSVQLQEQLSRALSN
ncbi:response regulator, partial [bacterium]|nr:response regulator [bacterium]